MVDEDFSLGRQRCPGMGGDKKIPPNWSSFKVQTDSRACLLSGSKRCRRVPSKGGQLAAMITKESGPYCGGNWWSKGDNNSLNNSTAEKRWPKSIGDRRLSPVRSFMPLVEQSAANKFWLMDYWRLWIIGNSGYHGVRQKAFTRFYRV